MRRALYATLLATLAVPATAAAQSEAPPSGAGSGGSRAGVVTGIRPAAFSVAPGSVVAGAPVTISFRIVGRARRVRVRVDLVRTGTRRPVAMVRLGRRRAGVTVTRRWTPAVLPAGAYTARLHATDGRGHRLVRTSETAGRFPLTVAAAPPPTPVAASADGVFPVVGPFSFGGADARFGARRAGHAHQGQDVIAAMGTPLVSPVSGSVYWRAVQPSGAGHYLVIRDARGADYVFMHLVAGSELVAKGDAVAAGQALGQVGDTGDAQGAHLHFELWPDGWFAAGSEPIDPLPALRAWAAG